MTEWSPHLRDPQHHLFGAMLERIRECGATISGVLWYQGESDAMTGEWPRYQSRMDALHAALCDDLGQPDLPFLLAQLSRYATSPTPELLRGWNEVREQQRRWAATHDNVEIVSTIDLELTDPIHLNTPSLKRLGRRLAHASLGRAGLQPGPLTSETATPGKRELTLGIHGITGGLTAQPRPLGFTLRDPDGEDLHRIYHTELRADAVVLHLDDRPLPEGTSLWYGHGLDSLCNVTDHTDQALMAFGPVAVPRE